MRHLTASLLAGTAALLAATAPALAKPMTERVNVGPAGEEANRNSFAGVGLSRTGRFVVFTSTATNLVAQDQNETAQDVFLRDRRKGTTVLVSVSTSGEQANSGSGGVQGSVSRDGRYVVFSSDATNLVRRAVPPGGSVYVRDPKAGTTVLVSAARRGQPADNTSFSGPISGNGRFVAFSSFASNLVRGDTNESGDIFVRDLKTGVTTLESKSFTGGPSDGPSVTPAISGTGRFVAFGSRATNLVPGDTNTFADVFLRDRKTGETTLVSVSSAGGPADGNSFKPGGGVSDDGTVVAFDSDATDLVEDDTNGARDVFVHDLKAGTTARIAPGLAGNVSADGRYVAFVSDAPDLVPGDTNEQSDDFVYDRRTGTIARVNLSTTGGQAEGGGSVFGIPNMSADGRAVAFISGAANLVPGDTGSTIDVFVRDR